MDDRLKVCVGEALCEEDGQKLGLSVRSVEIDAPSVAVEKADSVMGEGEQRGVAVGEALSMALETREAKGDWELLGEEERVALVAPADEES